MLHKFLEPGDWFAAKSRGYGSGLPIAWQGWVLTVAFVALITGLALMAEFGSTRETMIAVALMIVSTVGFLAIVRKRTRGGWRWRWGERD